MRFKISYIKESTPINKITNVKVSCKTVKQAVQTAQENMGDNNMACVYYGKNNERLQVVYPTKK